MGVLKPVKAQPGQPLYLTVRDVVRQAIDAGIFAPGQQMPSTKVLSTQLSVSLVTTHRALQALMVNGVVQRSQGKGTFVHHDYSRRDVPSIKRVGLILRSDDSLCSYFLSQMLENIRQAARRFSIDLILHHSGTDAPSECDGLLFLSPSFDQIEAFLARRPRKPALMVGATSNDPHIAAIDIDNIQLPRMVIKHFCALGHARIGYVGSYDNLCVGRNRWEGFLAASQYAQIVLHDQHVIRAMSWKLEEREKLALVRLLSSANRPTAIFAAGIELALDVYAAASTAGLRVPQDLSVIAVDDPPSAPQWNPPITTIRQPLARMGQAAITALNDLIRHNRIESFDSALPVELILRNSTAALSNQK
jgi:LacI family transcriptional regulator